jgi:hypothetical protein
MGFFEFNGSEAFATQVALEQAAAEEAAKVLFVTAEPPVLVKPLPQPQKSQGQKQQQR